MNTGSKHHRSTNRYFTRLAARNRPMFEAGIWAIGFVLVAVANPFAPALIDVCLFKAAGLPFCPGCGLGHAIGFLARGEILLSIQSHPLGIPVTGILLHRVFSLFRQGIHTHSAHRESTLNYV